MNSNKADKGFRGHSVLHRPHSIPQLLHTQNYRPVTGVGTRITVSPTSATQVTCYITQRVKWPHSQNKRTCTQKKTAIERNDYKYKNGQNQKHGATNNDMSIPITILNYPILCRSLMFSTSPLYALSCLLPNWAYVGFLASGAVGRDKKKISEPPTRADRPKSFTWDWG